MEICLEWVNLNDIGRFCLRLRQNTVDAVVYGDKQLFILLDGLLQRYFVITKKRSLQFHYLGTSSVSGQLCLDVLTICIRR